jgi:asparagine synthase (glutamine-hydrolysing)
MLLPADSTPQEEADRELLSNWTARQFTNCESADPVNQASALELGGYMANTLLRDTDAMSMAHSLEVRVPLIDHLLVERMMRIPGYFKLRSGEPKWLLVDATGDLPREIVDRPKRGFELPFKHWLAGPLRDQVSAALSSSKLEGVFRQGALDTIWNDFLSERVSWSRAWSIFALDSWCRANL